MIWPVGTCGCHECTCPGCSLCSPPEPEECPRCGGTGSETGQDAPCEACRGEGWV